MRFPRYAEYKDSGVEWLGEVPSHWECFIGKRLFSSVRQQAYKTDQQLAASQKYGVIPQELMMQLNDSKVMLALKGTDSFRHVDKNNFVISLRSFEGGIEHSDFEGCVSPAYTVLSPNAEIYPKFFKYLFKSSPFIAALQSTTDSLRDGKSISYEQFGLVVLPLLSINEQTQIAAFLDHETAKLDNLINEQKKLIELLKEKRQAVISTAVSKGLNPHAPMKDSGVEWLGEVPEGWSLRKLIYVTAKIGDGLHGTPKYVDESEYYFINGNNLVDRKIVITDKTRCVSYEEFLTQNYAFNSSTLFLSINGTIGNIAFYNNENLMLGKSAAFIDCKPLLRRDFLAYFFDSNQCQIYFNLSVTGTTISNLGLEVIRSLKVPLPSIQEQTTIVAFLDHETAKIDTLITKAESAIQLLQERRTALISAAVTGKIDVRGFVKTVAEQVNA